MIEPRPHLLKIARDVERGGRRVEYVRLDRNEQVSPVPEEQRTAMLASLHPNIFNAYPDPSPVYERLAKLHGVSESELFVTGGSDTAIRRIFETFVRPGDGILQPDPSYAMYQVYTDFFQGRAMLVPYAADRTLSEERLMEGIRQRPRLLLVANPDQPTGTAQRPEMLQRLAAAAREHDVVMIVDEAYHPFHPDSALAWRAQYDNVLVTRTFSKVGGLAGLRIGYLVGNPTLVDWVQRCRGSYEVNGVAIGMACYVLDHPEMQREHLRSVEAGREVLRAAAGRLGLGFPPCSTNFQLLEFQPGAPLQAIVDALKVEGYLIKGPFRSPSVEHCLRVSLAGPEILTPFTAALEKVLASLAVVAPR